MQPCPLQITACQMRSKSPCMSVGFDLHACKRSALAADKCNGGAAGVPTPTLRLCCTNALPAVVPLLTSMMWPAFKDCWPRDLT